MPRRRSPVVLSPRALAAALLAPVGTLLLVAACADPVAVGAGGECFLATDCAPGLVCVEQANESRVCTDDLTRAAGRPPAVADAEVPDANGGETVDGSALPQDSGAKDAGHDAVSVDDDAAATDDGGL